MESYGVKEISIPARSPAIILIQNFSSLISSKLKSEAIEKKITHELFQQFSEQIMTTITSYSTREIDKNYWKYAQKNEDFEEQRTTFKVLEFVFTGHLFDCYM